MWIYTNQAFLSIVADKDGDQSKLLVRSRQAGDIEAVFPAAKVSSGLGSDYRYRAWIPRAEVLAQIAKQVENIDYTNFKGSIPYRDEARHDAYMGCWSVMKRWQDRAERSRINVFDDHHNQSFGKSSLED